MKKSIRTRILKGFAAGVLCLLPGLLMTVMGTPAAAASPEPQVILSAPEPFKAGGTAEVTLAITGNPGISAMGVELDFPEELTLVSVTDSGIIPDAMVQTSPEGAAPYEIVWCSPSAPQTDGVLLTMTFSVRPDCPGGDYELTADLTANLSTEEDVPLAFRQTTLTVLPLPEEERPALVCGDARGLRGGLAAVTVSGVNGLCVYGAELSLQYDRAALELVDIRPMGELPLVCGVEQGSIVYASPDTPLSDGVLAVCYFRVLDGGTADVQVALTGTCYDEKPEKVPSVVFRPGAVSVLSGDISATPSDGSVCICANLPRPGVDTVQTEHLVVIYDGEGRMRKAGRYTVVWESGQTWVEAEVTLVSAVTTGRVYIFTLNDGFLPAGPCRTASFGT